MEPIERVTFTNMCMLVDCVDKQQVAFSNLRQTENSVDEQQVDFVNLQQGESSVDKQQVAFSNLRQTENSVDEQQVDFVNLQQGESSVDKHSSSRERILVEEKVGYGVKGVVFPGGHVEAGEDFRAAVIREMREETGLIIKNPRLMGMKYWFQEDGSRYIVLLYRCEEFEGELHSSSEGKVYWVDRDQILQQNLMWNMEEILQVMEGKASQVFLDSGNGWKVEVQ